MDIVSRMGLVVAQSSSGTRETTENYHIMYVVLVLR